MSKHSLRPINPLASFHGRYNPPPLPKAPLPEPVRCEACHVRPDQDCAACCGTGRVIWIGRHTFPATLRGHRYARKALKEQQP